MLSGPVNFSVPFITLGCHKLLGRNTEKVARKLRRTLQQTNHESRSVRRQRQGSKACFKPIPGSSLRGRRCGAAGRTDSGALPPAGTIAYRGRVIGTAINALAIAVGGVVGLASRGELSPRRQQNLKVLLGAFTVYGGLRATWIGLSGAHGPLLKTVGIVLAALMLSKLTGQFAGLQRRLNRLGRYAREQFDAAQTGAPHRFGAGFVTGAILFGLAPLGTLGALQEGLKGDPRALLIKAVMDGMATLAFARSFGWSVVAAAGPMVVYQGTWTLLMRALAPFLEGHSLLEPLYATSGLMVFMVSLVILQLRKVEVADYLPALLYAPLLAWATERL